MAKGRGQRQNKVRKAHADIVQTFARRIREVRKQRGLSQQGLSAKAGVNLAYLGRLERAEAAPGIDMLDRIAGALGVAPAALLATDARPREDAAALRSQAEENLLKAARKATDPTILQTLAVLGQLLEDACSRR